MNIITKDTNVVVLYGDGAVAHFAEMVNKWARMISSTQWDGFQFFLVGSDASVDELDEFGKKAVGDHNVYFCKTDGTESADDKKAPDASLYHSIIFDKVKTGNVRLHLVYDSGEEEFPSEWLKSFVSAAKNVEVLTTTCIYYCLFGINSPMAEREQMSELLQDSSDSVFLLGNVNESGARVTQEERWQATILAVLLNAAGLVPVGRGAYSLGYSALNANGSELRRLRESVACRALTEELDKKIETLSGDLELQLLPVDVNAVTGLYEWLTGKVRDQVPQIRASTLQNAWITIRMSAELPPSEAVKRVKRFVDLNYTGKQVAEMPAKELAWQTEKQLKSQLRYSASTARISETVLNEIADQFHRIAVEDVQPAGCGYPKKPLLALIGGAGQKAEHLRQCKEAVMKPIREYIQRKNICCFAEEMEKAYRRLAKWVHEAAGEPENDYRKPTVMGFLRDCQRELDSSDEGNASRIRQKYKRYAAELEMLNPPLTVLTEGTNLELFREDGTYVDKGWRELIQAAGRNLEKRLTSEFRGDFFRVLTSEFSTAEEREKFFDEYLKSGPRMYRNLLATPSSGTEVLLADDRLTDKWFNEKDLYAVKTDNAENLTVYPLGANTAVSYMADKTVYFKGSVIGKRSRDLLFPAQNTQMESTEAPRRTPRSNLFGNAASEQKNPGETRSTASASDVIRLEPDAKGDYRLYWEWNGNDNTAMVEFFQFGERVGEIAVVPVKEFKENGGNMNVTDRVMGGKTPPAGTLTVIVRDDKEHLLIDHAEVQGRRDLIRYKINNQQLSLRPDKSGLIEKVVLRTTETDGTLVYFPLYVGEGEKPWAYEGLSLSDGRIVEDPTRPEGFICPVLCQ